MRRETCQPRPGIGGRGLVTKQLLLLRRWQFIHERAFHFEPIECDPRALVITDTVTCAALARSNRRQCHGVKGNFLVGIQPHIELKNLRFERRHIEVGNRFAVERSAHDLGHLRVSVELDILHPLTRWLFFGETRVFPFVTGVLEIRLS